ncbi:MAG: hypothetical protein ACI4S3_02935 [Candidatus Gastranaerophilaceae bacterium]
MLLISESEVIPKNKLTFDKEPSLSFRVEINPKTPDLKIEYKSSSYSR